MRHQLVFLKFAVLFAVFLIVLPPADCTAQRNASRKAEKELFGKTGKSKLFDDKVTAKGAAGKAMKEQKKKEARRDKEDEKKLKELRKRQYQIQSTATQERMVNNGKKTEAGYKAKKQKQRKEQTKPAQGQPAEKAYQKQYQVKEKPVPGQHKPKEQAKQKQYKPKDNPVPKKHRPKEQPRLKQHKIKKYS